jgi:hypothetical protein
VRARRYRALVARSHASFASLLLVPSIAVSLSLAGSAEAATRYDLALGVGADLAHPHQKATGVDPAAQTSPLTVVPFASADETAWNARLALSASFEAQLFDQGDGLPRLLVAGGASVFLGNGLDGDFGRLHGGPSLDTGLTMSRPFTIDVALGAVFPLCAQPSCVELKASVGAAFARRGLKVWTDETATGGVRTSAEEHDLEVLPFARAAVDVPLCSTCSRHATRLRFGLVARSQPTASLTITSSTAKLYAIGVDTHVELEPQVALVLPL